MQNHFKLSDQQFEEAFKSFVLSPSLFTHEAHLRLAWIHITKYGIDKALETVPNQISQFVENLGARDKYNHTLTIAAIKAVYHFTLKSRSIDFPNFIKIFPRLKYHFKDLLACHYTVDIFNNELAKVEYLAPDLLPFD